jgi:hypothetical protein
MSESCHGRRVRAGAVAVGSTVKVMGDVIRIIQTSYRSSNSMSALDGPALLAVSLPWSRYRMICWRRNGRNF